MRASLHEAFFTSKGDRALVVKLYNEHIAKLGNVMVRFCEAMDGEYEGELNAAGEMEGLGTKRYADGSVYEGEWEANHKAGRGKMQGADGNVYEGEYTDGQREGRGIYRYPSGATYDGQWKAGKMDGRGTYHFANGNVYEGEYRADKKEGRGAFKYADGDIEVSCFEAGARVGEGVRWAADKHMAWRLHDGQPVEVISLEEAKRLIERIRVSDALQPNGIYLDVSSTFFHSNPALNPITDAITSAFTTIRTTEVSA